MSENSAKDGNITKKSNKRQLALLKLMVFCVVIIAGYFGYRYWQIQQFKAEQKRLKAKAHVEKFDNIESEIFDLSDEYKNGQNSNDYSQSLDEAGLEGEFKGRSNDFIYQNLLKNQAQIENLKDQIRDLKFELDKYKAREVIGRIIYSYIDFRQNLFAGKDFGKEFKSFESLASFDVTLQAKADKMKDLLPSFITQKKLQNDFAALIPDIISIKKNNVANSFISRIRYNISKLIVIRKIDKKEGNDVDAIIVRIEENLDKEAYQEALNNALLLNENYHDILKEFLTSLSVAIEVQRLDSEILNYLKILS